MALCRRLFTPCQALPTHPPSRANLGSAMPCSPAPQNNHCNPRAPGQTPDALTALPMQSPPPTRPVSMTTPTGRYQRHPPFYRQEDEDVEVQCVRPNPTTATRGHMQPIFSFCHPPSPLGISQTWGDQITHFPGKEPEPRSCLVGAWRWVGEATSPRAPGSPPLKAQPGVSPILFSLELPVWRQVSVADPPADTVLRLLNPQRHHHLSPRENLLPVPHVHQPPSQDHGWSRCFPTLEVSRARRLVPSVVMLRSWDF